MMEIQVTTNKGVFKTEKTKFTFLFIGSSVLGAVLIAYIIVLYVDKHRKKVLGELENY